MFLLPFLLKKQAFGLLALTVVLGTFITGCSHSLTTNALYRPQPVTDGGMTLEWSHDIKTQALEMISQSQKVCHLDMYELSDSDILQALESAHERGVDVRVIVDGTEKHSQTIGVPYLREHGIAVSSQHISRGISHIKMLITDGKNGGVLIGGMNYGAMSWDNNDASVYLPSPSLEFEALFRWDWSRAHGQPAMKPKLVQPFVVDSDIQEPVIRAIQSATHSVSLEAFDLTDKQVVSALLGAANRGLSVQVLLDPGQSYNRGTATKLRDAGISVRFYRPVHGELMHAKILDVDGGQTFIIGSANFSHQAYTYNHEGDLVLHNVPSFDKSLRDDLSIQISRGTDYPESSSSPGQE